MRILLLLSLSNLCQWHGELDCRHRRLRRFSQNQQYDLTTVIQGWCEMRWRRWRQRPHRLPLLCLQRNYATRWTNLWIAVTSLPAKPRRSRPPTRVGDANLHKDYGHAMTLFKACRRSYLQLNVEGRTVSNQHHHRQPHSEALVWHDPY